MSDSLSPKQAAFVAEYLVDLNGTQAAIRAGYRPSRAPETASRLVRIGKVAAAIAAGQAARSARVGLDADDVLRELKLLVGSNIQDYVLTEDGDVTLRPGVDPAVWRAVASLERETTSAADADGPIVRHKVKLRLWDKNAAIEKAMKHLGLLKDGPQKVKVTNWVLLMPPKAALE